MRVFPAGDVVVKEAETEPERLRLGREAFVLRAVAHPGVVRLERVEGDDPDRPERLLRTRVPGTAVSDFDRCATGSVLAWAAGVASILADLHDRGIAHGRVSADHILLDDRDRPVLCGFGSAGRMAEGADPAVDVVALAALVRSRLGPGEVGLRRTVARWESATRIRRRGGARGFARVLVKRAADVRGHPGRSGDTPVNRGATGPAAATSAVRTDVRPPVVWAAVRARIVGPRRLTVAALAVAALAAGVAGWSARTLDRPSSPSPSVRVPVPAYVLAATPGERLVMVVGRWGCGPSRPAVLDQVSGAVWTYPAWPVAGGRLTGRPLGLQAGATGLAVTSVRPGCDRLLVMRGSQPAVTLEGGGP